MQIEKVSMFQYTSNKMKNTLSYMILKTIFFVITPALSSHHTIKFQRHIVDCL